jgi:hypothetical protein
MTTIKTKKCTKCGVDKTISEFNKDPRSGDGLRNWCKSYKRVYDKAYRTTNKDQLAAKKRAYHERNKERDNVRSRQYLADHSEEMRKYQASYRASHKAKIAERDKKYYARNREKINLYHKKYHASHRKDLNTKSKNYSALHKEERAVANKTYKMEYPERIKANDAVKRAIKTGKLIRPNRCSNPDCNKPCKPDGHHWSYEEEHWLDVEWLCKSCHKHLHAELRHMSSLVNKQKGTQNENSHDKT